MLEGVRALRLLGQIIYGSFAERMSVPHRNIGKQLDAIVALAKFTDRPRHLSLCNVRGEPSTRASRDRRIVDANAIRAVVGDQTMDDLAEAAE